MAGKLFFKKSFNDLRKYGFVWEIFSNLILIPVFKENSIERLMNFDILQKLNRTKHYARMLWIQIFLLVRIVHSDICFGTHARDIRYPQIIPRNGLHQNVETWFFALVPSHIWSGGSALLHLIIIWTSPDIQFHIHVKNNTKDKHTNTEIQT